MVFILNTNIPETKVLKIALQGFYGIGPNVASKLCARLSIHNMQRIGDIAPVKISQLTAELTKMQIDMDLRRKIREDIKRLRDIGSYRGRRHAQGLPVRGQQTQSQIKTAKKLNRMERW